MPNPDQNPNTNHQERSMFKKILIGGGKILAVCAVLLATLYFTPLGNAMYGKTPEEPKKTEGDVSNDDNGTAPVTTSNDGVTKDQHSPASRDHSAEVVANSQDHEALKDVPRVQASEVLRKEDFMVNGELVTNLDRVYMLMPDDTHLPDNNDPVARLHYRLNYSAINGAGLDPNLLNSKHFDVVHYTKSSELSDGLADDEKMFFGRITVTFKDDGKAILNLSTGLADDGPDTIPTTTVRHTRTMPSP